MNRPKEGWMAERRYWVNLGMWPGDSDDKVVVARDRACRAKLKVFATHGDGEYESLSFVTSDIEEAERVEAKARKIIERCWPDDPGVADGVGIDLADGVGIAAQPRCSKCGKHLRFKDQTCKQCGGDPE